MADAPHYSKLPVFSIILFALILTGLSFFSASDIQPGETAAGKAVSDIPVYQPAPSGRLPVPADVLSFLFFGDLMLDRHVGEKLQNRSLDYLLSGLASSTADILLGRDLVGVNLEGALTDGGQHYQPIMSYDFAFSPERVGELKRYGFNFFNIANNHITDQGAKGLGETRKNLSQLGFNYSGDADAKISSSSLTLIDIRGKKVALIGLSMVYNDFDLAAAEKFVKDAEEKADIVIINIHWGTEYEHQFNKHQQSVGRAFIDSGADVIIGHHPHVVQGMEIYQGKPIFYSLGNFIFDQYFSSDTQQGLAVGLNIEPDKIFVFLFPLQSKSSAPNLMAGENKINFLKKYADWSRADEGLRQNILEQKIEIAETADEK
jgi:poly-gamma-glutamate synthesis protein (capsule biosynthesis protein)